MVHTELENDYDSIENTDSATETESATRHGDVVLDNAGNTRGGAESNAGTSIRGVEQGDSTVSTEGGSEAGNNESSDAAGRIGDEGLG